MKIDGKMVLICDCEGSMPLDGAGLATAFDGDAPTVHTQLCRRQLAAVRNALGDGAPLLIACTQEAPLFDELRAETNPETALSVTNIRERAGWSDEAAAATPKIAALLAEAALDIAPARALEIASRGVLLIYGRDETALEAAQRLAPRLDVTVLLRDPGDVAPPRVVEVPIFKGRIAAARGHFGAFELTIDDHASALPSSRAVLAFAAPRDGAISRCDLILDLTGDAALFPAADKRDGYVNPDPRDPAAVARALFDLADMVGDFEKPIYVDFSADLCAHGRNGKIGCTRCLDACPAGAIAPDGDHVAIDPMLCGGCGHCASVCPTGAAAHALPPGDAVYTRLRVLLSTYARAGGAAPLLLVHDSRHGEEMISLAARHGRGLPARVLPFALNEVTQVGFDLLAAALAHGAAQVRLLIGRRNRAEAETLAGQVAMIERVTGALGYGAGRVALIDEDDPVALADALHAVAPAAPIAASSFLPMGGKRMATLLALGHLHAEAPTPVDRVALDPGAPFGAVRVDIEGCTLCLSCVGACPTGALIDNPDRPMLRFREDACIQCGLCRVTCPEGVIALEPRIDFTAEAREAQVVHEEEPFACVRCGKPFGIRAAIERLTGQLADHPMFADDAAALERLRMCQDCRVVAHFADPQPMATRPRPPPRTTDDDLREREQAKARAMHERSKSNGGDTDG